MLASSLRDLLRPLYKDEVDRIDKELSKHIEGLHKAQSNSFDKYWYKLIDLYCVYPDGVVYDKAQSPLRNLIPHVRHVKELGCNALHILPFLDSPMVDKGFDVKDFYKIRPELGTLQDLKDLKKEADAEGIRVFMDLVFNHISDQHEWFQKAIGGDEYYRDFFIWQKEKPDFIRLIEKDNAVWGEYMVEGKKRLVRIEFPQHAGPIPHWEKREDGNWYYHTYYPQQMDLNWFNPNVFIEAAKILLYWASLGFNFRLDATPFIGKPAYKQVDGGNEYTHIVLAGLKFISEKVNSDVAFLVESYESVDTVVSYFGTSNKVVANLGYNFHLCAYTWTGIVLGNPQFIWDMLKKLSTLPKHGEWINFLRNHDELSLGYIDEDVVQAVKDVLLPRGVAFGEGIAGRTFSLLGENKSRFLMAYFLVASFPGGMLIPYGDEVAKRNIPVDDLDDLEKKDARNINRGRLAREDFEKENQDVYEGLKEIVGKRKLLRDYLNVAPVEIKMHEQVFSGTYKVGSSELTFIINLSDKDIVLPFSTEGCVEIVHVNKVQVDNSKVTLGPCGGIWLQK